MPSVRYAHYIKEWGSLIQTLRRAQRWSRVELARRAGISGSLVTHIEAGAVCSRATVLSLAQALEHDPDPLLVECGYAPQEGVYLEVLRRLVRLGREASLEAAHKELMNQVEAAHSEAHQARELERQAKEQMAALQLYAGAQVQVAQQAQAQALQAGTKLEEVRAALHILERRNKDLEMQLVAVGAAVEFEQRTKAEALERAQMAEHRAGELENILQLTLAEAAASLVQEKARVAELVARLQPEPIPEPLRGEPEAAESEPIPLGPPGWTVELAARPPEPEPAPSDQPQEPILDTIAPPRAARSGWGWRLRRWIGVREAV